MGKCYKPKKAIFRVIMCNICIASFLLSLLIIRVQQSYAQDVTEEWVARYDGPANDYNSAYDIVTDLSENVYVTGESYGIWTDSDYVTVSYDSFGNERWVARYDGEANSADWGYAIDIDSSGNIYVTGGQYWDRNNLGLCHSIL